MARIARRITKRAKSRGFSATVVSLHCCRSSETFAGSPSTTRARCGFFRWFLGPSGQTAGHPEHPHRNHRPVVVGLEEFDEARQHGRRRIVVGGQLQHLDVRVRVPLPLLREPTVEHFAFCG
jgi:hypothetical protein